MSTLAVGMVLGSIAIGMRPPHSHRGILVFLLTTLEGVIFASIGLVPIFVVSCTLAFLMGLANGIVNTILGAMMQELIADEYRGRVFSLTSMIAMGMTPISLAIAGGLTDTIGASIVFIVGGAICMMASLFGLTFREIRELQ